MKDKEKVLSLEYNTERPSLIIPEYGRAVHTMVSHCLTIADREERNKCAQSIIAIMGNLFPYLRDEEEYRHKLWDHLFIMSKFELDVDSPYPRPTDQTFLEKPDKIEYPKGDIKYGHYGRVTQNLIDKASALDNPEHTKKMGINLFFLMKRSYMDWSKSHVDDDVILKHLRSMSNGKIDLSSDDLPQGRSFHHGNNNNNNRRRKWNNNKNKKRRHN